MPQVQFNEDRKRVPTIDFDYGAVDPVEGSPDPEGDREILKLAFALLLSPAPAKIAAARVCLIYKLLHPGIRTVDACRLYHGVRRDDVNEAHRELASLLSRPDQEKTPGVFAPEVSHESEPIAEDGGADAR